MITSSFFSINSSFQNNNTNTKVPINEINKPAIYHTNPCSANNGNDKIPPAGNPVDVYKRQILGPTGGYIFSFPITALIISYLVHYRSTTIFKFGALILGTIICYLIGTLWFMYIMKMSFSASLIICVLPFLPGDVLKIFIAAALTNKFKNIIKD